jgi:RNA polymerase sigma-70 factor (ECF subfamily)
MDAERIEELVARAQRRDADAFDAIIDAYGPRLYGYFHRICGSREEAEDLLQELFLRVVRMIDRYEHQNQFDAWLFRIATNLIRDRVRKTRRTPATADIDSFGSDFAASSIDAEAPELQPPAIAERREESDRLGAALAALAEPDREIVMLRHFSRLTFQEIADMLQKPLGTVLSRGSRALRKLRTLMESP